MSANTVDAAQAALNVHDEKLGLEHPAEPNVQLWHLLYSLHDWCDEHGLDLEREMKDLIKEIERPAWLDTGTER